jgi:hypothetical protein
MRQVTLIFLMIMLFSTLSIAQKVTPGTFTKKIGDYDTYSNGEVFFRSMLKSDYDILVASKKLNSAAGETFTSPTQSFSEAYSGYLVKFLVATGTINKLVAIGVSDGSADVKTKFGTMPLVASGWTTTKAYFKKEGVQVNIGLGTGTALTTFNAGFKEYELVKIIP